MALARGLRKQLGGLKGHILSGCEVPAEAGHLVTEERRVGSK
jgi:hypothetical protein